MNYKIFLVIGAIVLQACAQTKAYEGEKLPDTELAVIYMSEETKFSDGKVVALIEKANAIQVGDAWKGWPSKIMVKSGDIVLGLKTKEVSFGKKLAMGLGAGLGGAVGGAIAASADSPASGLISLKATVEKGKNYIVVISSESNSVENIEFSLQIKP